MAAAFPGHGLSSGNTGSPYSISALLGARAGNRLGIGLYCALLRHHGHHAPLLEVAAGTTANELLDRIRLPLDEDQWQYTPHAAIYRQLFVITGTGALIVHACCMFC